MISESQPAPRVRTCIRSFDGTESVFAAVCQPDRYQSLFSTLDRESIISIQGSSLSLPLAYGSPNGVTVNAKSFNRILSFVPEDNLITVEAGIRLGELLGFLIKNNFWFSPLPGHPNISVGGCVAFNVHGKGKGFFSDSVASFHLYHPSYGEVFASPSVEKSLFNLTLGGMGSTGFITDVTLKITPFIGTALRKRRVPVANLVQAVELMGTMAVNHDQVYSWNNLANLSSETFGQGYIYCEDFIKRSVLSKSQKFKELSSTNRGHHISSWGAPLMGRHINTIYGYMEKFKPQEELLSLEEGAFPISGKEFYYHLFGKRGYREYQMCVPLGHWEAFAGELQQLCQNLTPDITLGSLKLFPRSFDNYVNFCRQGVILAINARANAQTLVFFSEIDAILLKYKGIPSVYKDSRLSGDTISRAYEDKHRQFIRDLKSYDRSSIFTSTLLKRILG